MKRSIEHVGDGRSARRRVAPFVLASALGGQFFLCQAIVQAAWTAPFSLSRNYISDLGNTTCGQFRVGSEMLDVCSPWHGLMNTSFVLLGIGILLGSLLVGKSGVPSPWRTAAAVMIGLAGPGLVLVGLFPEDRNLPLHKAGAAVQFIVGNLGLVVLGIGMVRGGLRRPIAAYTAASGAVGLTATALFVAEQYLGLGVGGMERFAAYPLPLWLTLMGASAAAVPRLLPAP